ncbi:hypothetical protein [Bradyrhizobium vignae]|uniref:Uncharacterized protein n=1 Tax=Bradyrhizobium vignae TaxID=1549949 RepID=A0A2U3PUM2_9BRAD|nr:hypothetical protein [Bradyrhizobium vignae]SPP92842.1 protein of unknown function [Bradyrhizobium vignae]
MSNFKHLYRACGGEINPETLENFRLAIPEFHEFMRLAREFFAPRGKPGTQHEDRDEEHEATMSIKEI